MPTEESSRGHVTERVEEKLGRGARTERIVLGVLVPGGPEGQEAVLRVSVPDLRPASLVARLTMLVLENRA
jgi:hypothetical protein